MPRMDTYFGPICALAGVAVGVALNHWSAHLRFTHERSERLETLRRDRFEQLAKALERVRLSAVHASSATAAYHRSGMDAPYTPAGNSMADVDMLVRFYAQSLTEFLQQLHTLLYVQGDLIYRIRINIQNHAHAPNDGALEELEKVTFPVQECCVRMQVAVADLAKKTFPT